MVSEHTSKKSNDWEKPALKFSTVFCSVLITCGRLGFSSQFVESWDTTAEIFMKGLQSLDIRVHIRS